LDIDDFDLHLTPVLHSSSSTRVEPSLSTLNPVRIIPGPADEALMSTQEYMQKVIEDDDFKSGSWVSATNYVNANCDTVIGCLRDINNFMRNLKLDQVVVIIKSCYSNVLGDHTVTMKDLSGTIPGTVHYQVIGEGGYGKDITVGATLILGNVLVFSPKPLMHYLNITKQIVVKVFRKDTVPDSGSD
nr:hypothetical protein [Tanacetum cinerariifolium]